LRALIIPWAGLPEPTRTLMADFPHVAVHNLHYNSGPVAEMALALLLAAARRLVPADRALRAGDWTPRYAPSDSPLLAGNTALILGYGAIGRQVARLCRGLGMTVQATRRSLPAPESVAPDLTLYPPAALPDLLPGATALLVCVPHTPETTGLIGAAELALLPPHAVLVNISRGPVVDEQALYTALRDGRIYGAGLDVWYRYPPDEAAQAHTPPSAYPFHELDNVVLSPHRAAHTRATDALRITHLAALLNAAAAGDPLPNRVDVVAGY
jgi:phosphoglycerate dehydrogenase-like enzyme